MKVKNSHSKLRSLLFKNNLKQTTTKFSLIAILFISLISSGLIIYRVNHQASTTDLAGFSATDELDLSGVADTNTIFSEQPNESLLITIDTTKGADPLYVIPTYSPNFPYNYSVDCDNDGVFEATSVAGNYTCEYDTHGVYDIAISDIFTSFYNYNIEASNTDNNRLKLIDVKRWGDVQINTMYRAFYGASNMTMSAADAPKLDIAVSMQSTFYGASSFNSQINHWDVSTVVNMHDTFSSATSFDQPLDDWDTSNVTTMRAMFNDNPSFDQDISGWTTSNVKDMAWMFGSQSSTGVFNRFNQDISGWDVSSVEDMSNMFLMNVSFDQNLSQWDTSSATNMSQMFLRASSFDQSLAGFDMEGVTNVSHMLSHTPLSTANYDATLESWSTQNLQLGLNFGALSARYCAISARQSILDDFGWTINDSGEGACPGREFVLEVDTTKGERAEFTIQTSSTARPYNYLVDCDSDGALEASGVTSNYTCVYPAHGAYTISIYADFPRLYSGNYSNQPTWLEEHDRNQEKIIDVKQWGAINWASMISMFTDNINMTMSATDIPDMSGVSSMHAMFRGARMFNSDISQWDTSGVTAMSQMFYEAHSFNQPIGDLNTANVTDMSWMFARTNQFNQPLVGFDTSNVTNMASMFNSAASFDQSLASLNIEKVTNLNGILNQTNLSLPNYDDSLISWASQSVNPGLVMHASPTTYCAIEARNTLTSAPNNWVIVDGSLDDSCTTISLNLSTPTINLNITPGMTSSQLHTLTTSTNSPKGLTLTLSSTTNSTNLTHTTNSSYTIPTSTGTLSSPTALLTNTWGYRIPGHHSFPSTASIETNTPNSTYTWSGIPPLSNPHTILSTTNNSPQSLDIYYAAKPDSTSAPGVYQRTVLYTVVGN